MVSHQGAQWPFSFFVIVVLVAVLLPLLLLLKMEFFRWK